MELSNFKERYIAALPSVPEDLDLGLDEFHLYNSVDLHESKVSEKDKSFLMKVGLPRQAAPFLSFSNHEVYGFSPEEYFPIGADGVGNNILIEIDSGAIVLLDHDWDMKRFFINTSLEDFVHCLLIYTEYLESDNLVQCFKKMCDIDSNLPSEGEWWKSECS